MKHNNRAYFLRQGIWKNIFMRTQHLRHKCSWEELVYPTCCLFKCKERKYASYRCYALQASGTLVPPRAATHIIVALEKWKEERRKRRLESRAIREAEMQQRLPSRMITDISEDNPWSLNTHDHSNLAWMAVGCRTRQFENIVNTFSRGTQWVQSVLEEDATR